jgi:hypothetical protein
VSIDPQWIINLKGRDYPVFAGVLDAATKAGLRSLKTTIVQIPDSSNGHMAIVLVRAEFEDGRMFESVGDASPANCSAQIATAALRMAETRGAGRAMRNAINVGQTLYEEIPDDENGRAAPSNSHAAEAAEPEGRPVKHAQQCQWKKPPCEKFLTGKQCADSFAEFKKYVCPAHASQLRSLIAKGSVTLESA